jgi:hypothetical protein
MKDKPLMNRAQQTQLGYYEANIRSCLDAIKTHLDEFEEYVLGPDGHITNNNTKLKDDEHYIGGDFYFIKIMELAAGGHAYVKAYNSFLRACRQHQIISDEEMYASKMEKSKPLTDEEGNPLKEPRRPPPKK